MKTLSKSYELIRLIGLMLLTFTIFFLVSCETGTNEEPVPLPKAEFTPSTIAPLSIGEEISFTNQSTDAQSYLWDFGDNNTSDLREPTHSYSTSGAFEVSLTVTNASGMDIVTMKLQVKTSEVPSERYLEYVFDQVNSSLSVQYGADPVQHHVEIFQGEGDEVKNRPLILLSPGGAFRRYTRSWEISQISEDLARRGFVVGTLYHSVVGEGETPDFDIYVKSSIDQNNAVRFFKENATEYGIDPENIFIGGWSSGALISLHNALGALNEVSDIKNPMMKAGYEAALARYEDYPLYTHQSSKVKGALIMYAYTFELDLMDAEDAALMLINHTDARDSYNTLTWGTFNQNGISQYGIDKIRERALDVGYIEGKNLEYIKMTGPVVMSEFPTVEAMSMTNIDRIARFFYNNLD